MKKFSDFITEAKIPEYKDRLYAKLKPALTAAKFKLLEGSAARSFYRTLELMFDDVDYSSNLIDSLAHAPTVADNLFCVVIEIEGEVFMEYIIGTGGSPEGDELKSVAEFNSMYKKFQAALMKPRSPSPIPDSAIIFILMNYAERIESIGPKKINVVVSGRQIDELEEYLDKATFGPIDTETVGKFKHFNFTIR